MFMQNTSNLISAPTKILGWHFSYGTNLGYQDSRKIVLGETLSIPDDRTPIPCEYGFHCSESALDALSYAPEFTLWRVELEGDLQSHGKPIDKWAGRHRKAIAGGIDIKEAVSKFARDCALDVSHLWEMPAVMREFLETGNPELAREAKIAADAYYATNYTDAANAAYNTAAYNTAAYNTAAAFNVATNDAYYAAYAASIAACASTAANDSTCAVFNTVYFTCAALRVDIQVYKDKFEKICYEILFK